MPFFTNEFSFRRHKSGNSWTISSTVSTSLAPSLIRRFDPTLDVLVKLPGTASTSRPCSSAKRAVIRAPLRTPASTTTTPRDRPESIRLRCGKVHFAGLVSTGYSLTTVPVSPILSARLTFAAGYIWLNPEPRTATVCACASRAPWWTAVSIPTARPLTTTSPIAPNSRASRLPIALPYPLLRRVPTMAIVRVVSMLLRPFI